MVSIYKDMEKSNFKIVLNSALSNFSYNKYDVRNVIGTDVDYVLPKRTFNRNIQKNILDGVLPDATKNDIVIKNSAMLALEKIQDAFDGEAERLNLETEEDVVKMIKEFRKNRKKD